MSAASGAIDICWVSDRHLRVSLETHAQVAAACRAILGAAIPGLLDTTPAYATVLLTFDLPGLDPERAEQAVGYVLRGVDDRPPASPGSLVEIPVCYEGEFAPDIEEVGRLHGMSAVEVADLHRSAEYLVHFIGFSPGFGYLGGMPPRLVTPRLDRPRVRVPAGSVGIAGEQTGIYPHATPGGWRLIGRTPLRMFDAGRDPPALLAMGDRVRFTPIDAARFRALAAEGR